jgi:prephenate dehydrogenase
VLGIVGLGLIGTSVALAARRRWPSVRIVGVDRPTVLLHPTVVAALNVASPDLRTIADADVLVLAAPVDVIVATLPQLRGIVPDAELIIDTGSTKRHIAGAAERAGLHTFVGGHPMAGAASGGPDLSRADLFDNRPWLLVESPDAALVSRARSFVEALGARAEVVDAATHDAVMAAVSHVPQVVASILMTLVADAATDTGLAWAGNGLRDTTRLASSPPEMWASVLASNADRIAPLLTDLGTQLQTLAAHLDDAEEIERVFRAAAAARARLDRTRRS